MFKNYVKTDFKVFSSNPILLDFLILPHKSFAVIEAYNDKPSSQIHHEETSSLFVAPQTVPQAWP